MRNAVAGLLLVACSSGSTGHRERVPPEERGREERQATPERINTARLPEEPTPLGPLPTDVHPVREALAFELDPASERFAGTADLELRLDHPRDVIWLHGLGLAVTATTVTLASGATIAARWDQADPIGVARVTLSGPATGKLVLHVAFTAAFDPQLVGVYRVKTAVFSKFEAIYARRAFPCFDEPGFKIPFDVTLVVSVDDAVVGNMPISETAPLEHGRKRVRFATTPPLPTYLVAFAAGPFDTRSASVPANALRARPLPISGVALTGRGDDTAYALAEELGIIAEQERYFGLAFPYPKLDLVAVPDFQSGAMENAGAITFRDSALLVDDKVTSLQTRIGVTSILAHETAHQWFGDLVTMKWWDDLWLNEGFATFLATRTLRAIRPELEAELRAVESSDSVMDLDGLATARRIRQPIETTHDITNAFDGITYEKGAAFLTMLEHYLGDEPFRRGVHAFLVAHATGNATTDDLVAALSAESKTDLRALVGSFLDQPGVPLVSARVACTMGKGRVVLEQARWRAVGSTVATDARWTIPVCVRAGFGTRVTETCALLAERTDSIELGDCPDWVMPNAQAAGYYRFALAPSDLANLRDRGTPYLSVAERLAFANSLDAAFRSASLPGADVLRGLEPLARDTHGVVAAVPMGLERFVDHFMLEGAARAKLRKHFAKLYAPAARRMGWKSAAGEKPAQRLFRTTMLGFMVLGVEDPGFFGEAVRLGRRSLGLGGKPEAVDPDLAGLVLSAAARRADGALFDALVAQLVGSEDAQLRQRMLGAIGSVVDPALVSRALDLALDPRLRQNERVIPVASLLQGVETRDLAWAWLKLHFDALAPMLPDRYAGFFPSFYRTCDRARTDELRAFFTPRVDKLTGGPRNLAQALEAADQCAARVAAQQASVDAYAKTL